MDGKGALVLPIGGDDLANFILSLLGQTRTIEKEFFVPNLLINYSALTNLVDTIGQRVEQNKSALASFSCKYFFANGKITSVYEIKGFYSFLDSSPHESVGIDLNISYLIEFPGGSTEKQDIRIEVFSDSSIRKRTKSPKKSPNPFVKYTIKSTNVTWGEDISSHLDREINQLFIKGFLDRIKSYLQGISESSFSITLLMLPMLAFTFYMAMSEETTKHAHLQLMREESTKLPTIIDINTISAKIDFLIRNSVIDSGSKFTLPPFIAYGLFAALFLFIRTKRNSDYVVAFNNFTVDKLNKAIKYRDYITWSIYIALLVGIVASIIASHVDGFIIHGIIG